MINIIQSLAAHLPVQWQLAMKRLRFVWKIRTGRFVTNEPEFRWIEQVVHSGDSIIDVGASVGVYTRKFSELVGVSGRVYAFEPVPESFYLLTTLAGLMPYRNVTLFNIAASDKVEIARITVPRLDNYPRNYYRASLAKGNTPLGEYNMQVLCCPLDAFNFPRTIRLIKIDVEGHEEAVLKGMRNLIERDRPTLIVESNFPERYSWLAEYDYRKEHLPDSPNDIFHC